MSAVLRDLWPDDIQSQDVVSPEEILNHQAQQLEARTNGILTAHVVSVAGEDRVILGFEVEAPRLETRIRLFGAQHRQGFEYPVQILPPDGNLPDYLKARVFRPGQRLVPLDHRAAATTLPWLKQSEPGTLEENEWLATSPAEFTEKLEALLGQPAVKAAVLSLLARANRQETVKVETPKP